MCKWVCNRVSQKRKYTKVFFLSEMQWKAEEAHSVITMARPSMPHISKPHEIILSCKKINMQPMLCIKYNEIHIKDQQSVTKQDI